MSGEQVYRWGARNSGNTWGQRAVLAQRLMNFIYKNKYQMSKFSKSLFIIIRIFFYPRFILAMILILTVKPKYPRFLQF